MYYYFQLLQNVTACTMFHLTNNSVRITTLPVDSCILGRYSVSRTIRWMSQKFLLLSVRLHQPTCDQDLPFVQEILRSCPILYYQRLFEISFASFGPHVNSDESKSLIYGLFQDIDINTGIRRDSDKIIIIIIIANYL